MSFMSQAEILHLNEDLVCHVFKTVKGIELAAPSAPRRARWSVTAAINLTPALLGTVNVSDLVKDSFKVFSAVATGGIVSAAHSRRE